MERQRNSFAARHDYVWLHFTRKLLLFEDVRSTLIVITQALLQMSIKGFFINEIKSPTSNVEFMEFSTIINDLDII